jgi:DivIVA domain-containing protein
MVQPDYAMHVRQARFRRRLWGYRPGDVEAHLEMVAGWFSLAGIDELLDERTRQEAARIVTDARREADAIREAAQEEARATLERARQEAARERRGWSRLGRPAGARFNGG